VSRGKFLIVVQKGVPSLGRVGGKLLERGYDLDVCCPLNGDSLPEHLEEHAGAVVFGGPMSANDADTLPGIRAQLDWIPTALDSQKPFLGICLGAQLLARTLGATVQPHVEGEAEIGYFEVRPTAAGGSVFDGPLSVYHWHVEGFDLPGEAVLLAEGERFQNQAYCYGKSAFGVQFHPEVTREIIEVWMESAADKLSLPGAQPPAEQRAGNTRHDADLESWLDKFLDFWLEDG
jgi:GMP synthase (glutamine-hydrolysing)